MIECWSCGKAVRRASVVEADGYCPCCDAPIDFDDDDDECECSSVDYCESCLKGMSKT